MKFTKIALSLALIGTLSLAMAEEATTEATSDTTTTTETTTTDTTVSVDAEIAAIQAAPAQERVRMMNQFKKRLMQMNEAQRSEAIAAMQEKMQASQAMGTTSSNNAQAHGAMAQTRAINHANEMQMQTNEQMNQMQNMHQHRVANQVMNMPGNTPATVAPMGGAASGNAQFHMNMPRR
jgi:hypothetical protein